MRAEKMTYFDSVIPNASAAIKSVREQGKKFVGFYCVFAPQELIVAADAVPVTLCATKEEPIADGEKYLPRNFCPLIKSSYGFAITEKCAFFNNSEFIIGETTCDGKKKMFELMETFKPTVVLEVPQSAKGEAQKQYWRSEVARCRKEIEKRLGVTITDEKMKAAIKELNEQRALMRELAHLNTAIPAPLSGLDLLKVMWARNFTFDRAAFNQQLKDLIAELKAMKAKGEGAMPKTAKRIIVTGVPTGVGAEKVLKIIEESGAAVVYIENCSGMKQYLHDVATTGSPLDAIADKYLETPCSCMSPNTGRLELLAKLAKEYHADGVVDVTWVGCHTYNVESRVLKDYLAKHGNVPLLQIETDYSQGDAGQIKTRVEAFLEMAKKH
ncbi:double-cubane-cluster-containing anaerobic reductase [Methanoregula sp.]|jgi:benzoyl-CoA reductase/2-hydroxyglutaryl-CoA dehydratase subunit BcrC/BadD/HgdB|uniref:double-cubane-cluster-containing anaerobic reductase n=1 Tax=Methanoregula sp. TaxID=2052170 RepID=UPI003C22CABF